MKIDIISDIHLTCFRDHGAGWVASWVPSGETLVVAGDVGEFHWWQVSSKHFETLCKRYEHALYIAGNHDYYGTTLEGGDARFREIESRIPNLHFLEKDVAEINGVKFAGCSLWFEWDKLSHRYERFMNDFRLIQQFKPAVYDRNQESQEFLRSLQEIDVIVTHHLFSALSVHEKYINDPTTRFFLCEIDDILLNLEPQLAIHGHTHVGCDYKIGNTRAICNPMGYPGENDFGPKGYKPVTVEM